MAKNNVTIRNARNEVVMVIDRNDWERTELEAEERRLLQELKHCRRELRQLRDVHAMESV